MTTSLWTPSFSDGPTFAVEHPKVPRSFIRLINLFTAQSLLDEQGDASLGIPSDASMWPWRSRIFFKTFMLEVAPVDHPQNPIDWSLALDLPSLVSVAKLPLEDKPYLKHYLYYLPGFNPSSLLDLEAYPLASSTLDLHGYVSMTFSKPLTDQRELFKHSLFTSIPGMSDLLLLLNQATSLSSLPHFYTQILHQFILAFEPWPELPDDFFFRPIHELVQAWHSLHEKNTLLSSLMPTDDLRPFELITSL